MPYTAEHKQQTRRRIVNCAREMFNIYGYSEVSIDNVMEQAGLTRGGFYNHFRDKEDLFVEAIAIYGQCNPTDRWDEVSVDFTLAPAVVASQMIDGYLSEAHLADVGGHCPLIALPADVAQAGPRVKAAYRGLVEKMTRLFRRGLEDKQRCGDAERQAQALTALCVGAMLLARTIPDPEYGRSMLRAARHAAKKLLGP